MLHIDQDDHRQHALEACEKVHENVLQALRFWTVFEELNGKDSDHRTVLRQQLSTTAYADGAITTIKTMAVQTTILALWRIVDKKDADLLGAEAIKSALAQPRADQCNAACVNKVSLSTRSLARRLRRLEKVRKKLRPIRNYVLAHSVNKTYTNLKVRQIRLCLIYCVKLSRDANKIFRGNSICYNVYFQRKRSEADFFRDCFESGLLLQKREKRRNCSPPVWAASELGEH